MCTISKHISNKTSKLVGTLQWMVFNVMHIEMSNAQKSLSTHTTMMCEISTMPLHVTIVYISRSK